jgi:tetratricopeptide (TPR) repeat protein
VRVRFGIESFGVNAFTALADGGRVIEEHDELSAGAGRHEELYFVARGHAVFILDGEEVDAPAGTFVFISDPAVRRGAIGREEGTTVLVVGGVPGKAFQASPWEAWLEASPHLEAGEPERGIEIFERTLATYPGNPNVFYNLACFEALAGRADDALNHLAQAVEGDPRTREWAQTDSDFDTIRADPRFPAA